MRLKNTVILLSSLILSCSIACSAYQQDTQVEDSANALKIGAERMDQFIPLLEEHRVGIVANNTALVNDVHLVDTLMSLGIDISAVFAPEHGFRGEAADGAPINDGRDSLTGIQIRSLYGSTRKPNESMLADIDIMVFDIQDVGARFFTFISTMHYVMEACAEKGIPLIVLDRPNPNGNYVDGPIREDKYKSFVGMNPIPIVHGLTVGELATMINGEAWLEGQVKCDLTVVEMENWTHADSYILPQKPSPNLPTQESIILYPSLCLFEGTAISVGRGTYEAFSQIGHPSFKELYEHSFTPVSIPGMSTYPKHEDVTCYGLDLRQASIERKFTLSYIIEIYKAFEDKESFFNKNNGFDRLAGTDQLRKQIIEGLSEDEIRKSWEPQLSDYKVMRKQYLIYPEE